MNECKNCGKPIRVQIFKGGDWCSENCRKVLLGKAKCEYFYNSWRLESRCVIHGSLSKYGPNKGPNRPCLSVEPL